MSKESPDFLTSLAELMIKHNASIVRSTNSSNDLVILLEQAPNDFDEIYFSKEISEPYIRNKWYTR